MTDTLQRFIFDQHPVRGEHISLSDTLDKATNNTHYPDAIKSLLGEALAAAGLLVAILKIQGRISLQIQGDGSGQGSLLVAEANHKNELRGAVDFEDGDIDSPINLKNFFKSNALLITIEPAQGERYQGLVPLEGESLSDAIEFYFNQSEQLPTKLYLAADTNQARGLLLQTLPEESGNNHSWEHLTALSNTLSSQELLELDGETILYRLFHEETVLLFEPEVVAFRCTCSREKVENALKHIADDELREMIDTQEVIESVCGYCHTTYPFDAIDVEALIADSPHNQTLQ